MTLDTELLVRLWLSGIPSQRAQALEIADANRRAATEQKERK